MLLPEFPPDLCFQTIRSDDPAGCEFVFQAKKAALGPHIVPKWGWDEAGQRELHCERLKIREYLKILQNECSVGVIALTQSSGHFELDDLYIMPEHQNRGIGTRVLRHCIQTCRGMPLRLCCIKWNPVGSLYRRHGFVVIGETETHWLLERPV
jgi:GNAT superfamily N-acetyltransferase